MNYKRLCHNRLCRVLICLVLICCLIAQTVPARANAAGFVPGLYDIAANIGVNAALRAIGVGPGNSPDVFNQLVTDATNNLFEGLSPLTQVFLDYTQNGFRAFLSADFLSRVLSFCFSSGAVRNNLDFLPSKYHDAYNEALAAYKSSFDASVVFSCVVEFAGNYNYPYRLYFSQFPFLKDSGYIVSRDGSNNVYFKVALISYDGTWYFQDGVSLYGDVGSSYSTFLSGSSFSTSQGLVLDSVGDSLSSPVYSDWTAGAITQEDQPFVPVSIPSISDSAAIFTQTQAQAQAGTIPETVVDEIIAGSEVVPDTGTGTIADVISAIKALPQSIAEIFTDVIAGIKALPQTISDALAKAFAISDTFIATKVEALIAKYTYLEPMLTLGDQLKVYFAGLGTEPPIIYIDLGAATGSYYFGGRTVFVDLTWYEQYKPTMDAIIAGFLWLWVAWRLFQSVPGIIQGLSGIWGTPESVPDATFHNPKYQVGKNWLNSGSSYHRKGDRGE